MKKIVEYTSPEVKELTYLGKEELLEDIDITKYKILSCKPGACQPRGRCY